MMDVTLGQFGDHWMRDVFLHCLEEQLYLGLVDGLKSQGCDNRAGCYWETVPPFGFDLFVASQFVRSL